MGYVGMCIYRGASGGSPWGTHMGVRDEVHAKERCAYVRKGGLHDDCCAGEVQAERSTPGGAHGEVRVRMCKWGGPRAAHARMRAWGGAYRAANTGNGAYGERMR